MPRKPATDRADTLKDIRDAAFALFGRLGYDGVSIDAISKAANLSKGALYWYFDGKQLLYLDCLNRLYKLYDQHIFDPMLAEPHAMNRILLLFQGLESLVLDKNLANGVGGYWLGTESTSLPGITQARQAFETRTTEIVRDALELGMQQGGLQIGDDVEDIARAIVAIMEVITLPLRHKTPDEVHRVLSAMVRTLLRAYSAEHAVESFQPATTRIQ